MDDVKLDRPRRPASIVLSVVFALFALDAWVQVLLAAIGSSDDPPTLTALHIGRGLTAAATAWGSWRRARWAWWAAIAFGAVTGGMLAALPPLLHLPADARQGIWTGAVVIVLFALLCAAYFRSDARRQAGRSSTDGTLNNRDDG